MIELPTVDIRVASAELREEAAVILHEAFSARGIPAWRTMEEARQEVIECCVPDFICLGYAQTHPSSGVSRLLGWVGLRPQYELTWELHPLAVRPASQGLGIGRELVAAVEQAARERGIIGITLGADDETGETTLSGRELESSRLFDDLRGIRNLKRHPYGFYLACGYEIVGAIPHANGFGKPDIWMWKNLKPGAGAHSADQRRQPVNE